MGNAATTRVSRVDASNTPVILPVLRPLAAHAMSAWRWLERKRTQQLSTRRLRVTETVSLGEKRSVSILQVDGAQFLIGTAGGNVSLLAALNRNQGEAGADWRAASATQEIGG